MSLLPDKVDGQRRRHDDVGAGRGAGIRPDLSSMLSLPVVYKSLPETNKAHAPQALQTRQSEKTPKSSTADNISDPNSAFRFLLRIM